MHTIVDRHRSYSRGCFHGSYVHAEHDIRVSAIYAWLWYNLCLSICVSLFLCVCTSAPFLLSLPPSLGLLSFSRNFSRVLEIWKLDLKQINEKASEALADPLKYPNLFPDLVYALQVCVCVHYCGLISGYVIGFLSNQIFLHCLFLFLSSTVPYTFTYKVSFNGSNLSFVSRVTWPFDFFINQIIDDSTES